MKNLTEQEFTELVIETLIGNEYHDMETVQPKSNDEPISFKILFRGVQTFKITVEEIKNENAFYR